MFDGPHDHEDLFEKYHQQMGRTIEIFGGDIATVCGCADRA
ncbi:hypothetical protein ASZ90_015510 [hydrocarbon metagenome]|uniref:Uncharacterized protein n=1 Tax=hydrocarbon metagenome TaxID=938273 RepID=A0A0W8F1T3_9ZZZZ